MLECGDVSCVSTGFSNTSSKNVTQYCQFWTKSKQDWNRKGVVFWDSDELAGPRQENLLAGFSSFNQARLHAASENM